MSSTNVFGFNSLVKYNKRTGKNAAMILTYLHPAITLIPKLFDE
jgi:hypothetical protein